MEDKDRIFIANCFRIMISMIREPRFSNEANKEITEALETAKDNPSKEWVKKQKEREEFFDNSPWESNKPWE